MGRRRREAGSGSAEPARELFQENFLRADFRFPVSTRLLLDTSVLLGLLFPGDGWHRVVGWLFRQAIFVPQAPRTFIVDRVQGEFVHQGYRLLMQDLRNKRGRELTFEEQMQCRQEVTDKLEAIMGPYPKVGYFPGSESVMAEWRTLYSRFPFGETDALLLATCNVYGLDLLTVDGDLVDLVDQYRQDLTRGGYHFGVYHTPDPNAPLPAESESEAPPSTEAGRTS